jgi:hypothetical protein
MPEMRYGFTIMPDGSEVFVVKLGCMPAEDVAYFACRAALAKLRPEQRDRVLVRLAHPEPDDG